MFSLKVELADRFFRLRLGTGLVSVVAVQRAITNLSWFAVIVVKMPAIWRPRGLQTASTPIASREPFGRAQLSNTEKMVSMEGIYKNVERIDDKEAHRCEAQRKPTAGY